MEMAALPVPLKPIAVVPFAEELLTTTNCPVAAPADVGSNTMLSAAVWPGDKVAGNPGPDNAKPAPVTAAELIVTGTVPVDVNVTDCVADVLTMTSPNATLVALMLSARTAALSCRVKFFITPPALAVTVTA
jgi:hypothetical protein